MSSDHYFLPPTNKTLMLKTNKQRLFLFSLLTLGWLVLIYIESAQPPLQILGEIAGLDKVAHFVAYSILGLMLLATLSLVNTYKKIPVLILTVLLVVIAGLFDEFHQAFVPLRNSDVWDLLADFCGGLFATLLFVVIKKLIIYTKIDPLKI
jgi:VanZ family protein